MQPKFEIDKQTLEETKHCHGHYKCLDDYFPKCGEIIKGIESVICCENMCVFCYYKLGVNIDNPVSVKRPFRLQNDLGGARRSARGPLQRPDLMMYRWNPSSQSANSH